MHSFKDGSAFRKCGSILHHSCKIKPSHPELTFSSLQVRQCQGLWFSANKNYQKNKSILILCKFCSFSFPFGVHFFLFTHDTSVPVKWQPQLHKLLRVRRTRGGNYGMDQVKCKPSWSNNKQPPAKKGVQKALNVPPFPPSVNNCQPHSHFIFPRWF